MENNKISHVTVDLNADDLQKLQSIAALRKQSMSDIIGMLIKNHIFQYELNPSDPEGHTIQKTIEKVLKEYAPMLEKLSKT